MDKDKVKKENIEKFSRIYADVPEHKQVKRDELIEKLAMLCVTIKECEENLLEQGNVVSMSQGSYSIDRENPYSKVLDRTMKTYLSVIAKLDDMLPDEKASNKNDELLEFLGSR